MRKNLSVLVASLATVLALTACGGDSSENTTSPASSQPGAAAPVKVVVGASPVPHAKILEYVRDNLAKDAGIDLEIKEFDDYVTPNLALNDKSLDANYFQHLPYLEAQEEERGYKFEHGEGIHIEPYAAFSKKFGLPPSRYRARGAADTA